MAGQQGGFPIIGGHLPIQLLSTSGGYGDVYLYEEIRLHRKVAVKVIRESSKDPAARARFEVEAHTMAALEHPHVVRIYGTGVTGDDQPYISMMYCPQPTLAQRVSTEGQLPIEDVLRIGVEISGAVESAHRAGILHRDIKPANLLTLPWDAAGLTDFGVAAQMTETDEDDEDVGVSIPWSPPEMLFSKTRGSAASDVYSLAATIWHLLVGRSPFEIPAGDNSRLALMSRIRDAAPPDTGIPGAPPRLDRVLTRALAKTPAQRYPSVAAFGKALIEVQQDHGVPTTTMVVLGETKTRPSPADLPTPAVEGRTRRRSSPLPRPSGGRTAITPTPPTSDRFARSGSGPRTLTPVGSGPLGLEESVAATRSRADSGGGDSGAGGSRTRVALLVVAALIAIALAVGIPMALSRGGDQPTPRQTITNPATTQTVGLGGIPASRSSVAGFDEGVAGAN